MSLVQIQLNLQFSVTVNLQPQPKLLDIALPLFRHFSGTIVHWAKSTDIGVNAAKTQTITQRRTVKNLQSWHGQDHTHHHRETPKMEEPKGNNGIKARVESPGIWGVKSWDWSLLSQAVARALLSCTEGCDFLHLSPFFLNNPCLFIWNICLFKEANIDVQKGTKRTKIVQCMT